MQCKFAQPGWCHDCSLKKLRVSHLGLIFCHSFIFLTFSHFFILPPKCQSQMTNLSFSNCMHDIIQVGQICTACCKNKYTCKLLLPTGQLLTYFIQKQSMLVEISGCKVISWSWFINLIVELKISKSLVNIIYVVYEFR